jgi:hypothetical protein
MKTKHPEPCLCCQKRTKLYARGICSSCYQKWRRVMKLIPVHRHDAAEQKLIAEGKLLPVDTGPNPDSNPFARDLAEFLTDSERTAEAQGSQGLGPPEPVPVKKKRGRPKRARVGRTS